jgi:hypothetical protein
MKTKTLLPQALRARITQAALEDGDLLEKDLREAQASAFSSHCRRVWQRLNREDREALRRSLRKKKDSFLLRDSFVEHECIALVEKILRV